MPSAAWADVLDVGTDGVRAIYRTPGIFRDTTFEPIAPMPVPAASRAEPAQLIGDLLTMAAQRYRLDPALLTRLAWNESRFRSDAVSVKGAVGVMQLMEDTARDLGVNRHDLRQNILGGAAYLRQLLDRYGGDTALALAAYNAGPQAVDRFGGLPPFRETIAYVHAILGETPKITPSILFDR